MNYPVGVLRDRAQHVDMDSSLAASNQVNPVLVASLTRAYHAAIRAEEAAATVERAWSLAKVSGRALAQLQLARAGLPIVRRARPLNRWAKAKVAFQALATLGRVIACAVARKLALAKAAAIRAARRVVPVAVAPVAPAATTTSVARRALRTVLRAIVSLLAPISHASCESCPSCRRLRAVRS